MTDERKFYVYEWYVVDTNEVFYVGKGCGNRLNRISCRNKFFQDIYKSHKSKARKIYENLTEKEAFEKEIETIKYYKENTNYRLTNQTNGGEGTAGWVPSKEFCDKQSSIHKSQWRDEKYRKKMIQIRNDKNGSYKSQEFRDKISKLVKGKNNPNYNNHWSDKQKEVLRIKQQNNPLYRKNRFNHLVKSLKENPHIKPLICLEDLTIYHSKTELAKKLNITTTKITWFLEKNNKFIYNNKTYILLKNF